jgi:phosphotriesterase-related protein
MTEDDLVDEFVRYSIAERWGALGEIGTSPDPTPDEKKVLRAAGRASAITGLPVFSHTGAKDDISGAAALEQLDIFESAGVNKAHLVIGHMGGPKMEPLTTFATICKRGAFVGFDRVGGWPSDEVQVAKIKELIAAGYVDNILLASDGGGEETQMKAKGGPGHARAYTVFVPKLRAAGVDDATLKKITTDNPRRLLAFVPKLKPTPIKTS